MASISRRSVLSVGALAPMLSACTTDLNRFSAEQVPALAVRLGICNAHHVVLQAGRPGTSVQLRGCPAAEHARADSVFQAASLTKPVIAAAALSLVLDGKLDLQAPVSQYLRGGYQHRQNPFANAAEAQTDQVSVQTLQRMTVAQLLNHSSGLPNWTRGALAPAFEPGARWQYSGEGYALLQAVISAVAGQDIESLVSTRIFQPFSMHRSRLRMTDDIRQHRVGHAQSVWALGGEREFEFREPNAAASLYSTPADYANFVAGLWANKALLALTLSRPIAVQPRLSLAWGLGWGIEHAAGGPYLWQWGNNPGYRAFAMVSATSGDGFVLMTNSDRGLALAPPLAHASVPAEHGVFRFGMLG